MDLKLNWTDFKSNINIFGFDIRYVETSSGYSVWGTDGIVNFLTNINKDSGADQIDFETNYKTLPTTNQATFGKTKSYVSPRPEGCTTYFTSAGDNGGMSQGNELIFKMLSTDSYKQVDISFSEDVWFKDGQIWCSATTPVGACLDTEIVHPQYGVVGSFGRKILLVPDWIQPLDTEDSGKVSAGLIVRLKIHNANGQGDHDQPANFTAIGRLEIYRVGQV